MRGKRRNSPELPDASAGTPEERRERARQDFTFFRRAYFPHYCLVGGDSRLHEWLDAELPRMADAPEGVRLAIAAPRGEAKSTFVSLFFVLWAVLTGRKHYILIIADALEQAASLLGAVKDELEFNEALKRDFPGAGKGHVWNVGTVVTPGNVKIQALGAGKRMRGLRHGPHRPDLIVLDDLENDGNVDKPEQRDKLQSWLQKTRRTGAWMWSMSVRCCITIPCWPARSASLCGRPGRSVPSCAGRIGWIFGMSGKAFCRRAARRRPGVFTVSTG